MALRAVHEARMTYNDLKPSNIMMEESASEGIRVYLIDFGLSKCIESNDKFSKITFEGNLIFSSLN